MTSQEKIHIQKLAELNGKADSRAMHRILELAMTDEEAKFILALPAPNTEMAAQFDMTEEQVEARMLNLARRGLIVSSRKGYRYPKDPGTLHDNILASNAQYIPEGMEERWMKLYEGEQWWREIGESLAAYGIQVLRTIPVMKSVPAGTDLLPVESITAIIEANRDLITVRHCCCRRGARKCHNPTEVCMQFKRRAEYDLYRGSGRKVSVDEAVSVAMMAGGAGLVPTVTNINMLEALEFICFCCGDCCLVLDPLIRLQNYNTVLAPSRFEAKINNEKCNGCNYCVPRCQFRAIELKPVGVPAQMKAVLDPDKCVGCGACELVCEPGAITMELVRPPESIPESLTGPAQIVHN